MNLIIYLHLRLTFHSNAIWMDESMFAARAAAHSSLSPSFFYSFLFIFYCIFMFKYNFVIKNEIHDRKAHFNPFRHSLSHYTMDRTARNSEQRRSLSAVICLFTLCAECVWIVAANRAEEAEGNHQ